MKRYYLDDINYQLYANPSFNIVTEISWMSSCGLGQPSMPNSKHVIPSSILEKYEAKVGRNTENKKEKKNFFTNSIPNTAFVITLEPKHHSPV